MGADRNTEVVQVILDLQNLPKHSRNFSNTVLDSSRLTNIWNNNVIVFFFMIEENKERQIMHDETIHQMPKRIKD